MTIVSFPVSVQAHHVHEIALVLLAVNEEKATAYWQDCVQKLSDGLRERSFGEDVVHRQLDLLERAVDAEKVRLQGEWDKRHRHIFTSFFNGPDDGGAA